MFHLALTDHYWGKGETADDARAACRKAGGKGAMALVRWDADLTDEQRDSVFVDQIGNLRAVTGTPSPAAIRHQGERTWKPWV